VSDGDHNNEEDPVDQRDVLVAHSVNIFTVGVGAWLKNTILRNLATKPGYYGDRDEWTDMLLNPSLTTVRPGKSAEKFISVTHY